MVAPTLPAPIIVIFVLMMYLLLKYIIYLSIKISVNSLLLFPQNLPIIYNSTKEIIFKQNM